MYFYSIDLFYGVSTVKHYGAAITLKQFDKVKFLRNTSINSDYYIVEFKEQEIYVHKFNVISELMYDAIIRLKND